MAVWDWEWKGLLRYDWWCQNDVKKWPSDVSIYATYLSRVCDLAGSTTWSSSPSDRTLPWTNTVQIFSEEIMKFQKLWGRGTLYHISPLPLSLLNPGPSECPSCSYVGLKKAPASPCLYSNRLFWGSVASSLSGSLSNFRFEVGRFTRRHYMDGLRHFPAFTLPYRRRLN